MIHISIQMLIITYMIGWTAAVLVGMFIMDRMWKKHIHQKTMAAFTRGWNAGFGYLQRISDVRTERDSSVRIMAERAID